MVYRGKGRGEEGKGRGEEGKGLKTGSFGLVDATFSVKFELHDTSLCSYDG